MRTPAGRECKFFYGDYHRGRNVEECRLLKVSAQRWTAALCKTCPLPAILLANACPYLQFRATVTRPLTALFQQRVQVRAFCEKSQRSVAEPQIGCGECHSLPPSFEVRS